MHRASAVITTCAAITACAALAALVTSCTRAPARSAALSDPALTMLAPADRYDRTVRSNLEKLRAATTSFHDIKAAQAVGYPATTPACLKSATGGMGQHYVARALLDAHLDVEKPEILLYAPQPDGTQKLVAVEYIIPLSAWTHEQPPRIFGQSLKRSEELKLWYLHVWAWERNSEGLFADWNPAVKC